MSRLSFLARLALQGTNVMILQHPRLALLEVSAFQSASLRIQVQINSRVRVGITTGLLEEMNFLIVLLALLRMIVRK